MNTEKKQYDVQKRTPAPAVQRNFFQLFHFAGAKPVYGSRRIRSGNERCSATGENTRGGLHKLKTMASVVNNAAVYLDVYKMNIALLWSEVLNLLLKKEPKNDALFDFIRYSVEYLNTTKFHPFLFRDTKEAGQQKSPSPQKRKIRKKSKAFILKIIPPMAILPTSISFFYTVWLH